MIEPEIKAIMELGRQEQQRMLIAAIIRLQKEYTVAGNRVSNVVATSEGFTVQQTLDRVEGQIAKISGQATRLVERNVATVINLSLKSTAATAKIYSSLVAMDTVMHLPEFRSISQRLIDASRLTVDGIELSAKIWDLNKVTMATMRRIIVTDLINQVPLNITAQKMKKLLIIPDSDMRTKKWRLFFKENPPGRGVYKSAFKNVQRVLVTESNRAYRLGTEAYSMAKPWVRSNKWNRSESPADCDRCNTLATQDIYGLGAGQYPPGSSPSSPHPFCECYITIEPLDELRIDQINVAQRS